MLSGMRGARRDAQRPGTGGGPAEYLRALRPHQWVKNALVFLPLITAHATEVGLYLRAAAMFAALSACASGAYVLNDLLDRPHDRRHPSKRHRPLAAGTVRLPPIIALAALLAAGGIAAAFRLSAAAGGTVLLYLLVTAAYSLALKRGLFVDIMTLSILHLVRILAGGVAASVPISPWFLAFFLFAFIALAAVKRVSELYTLRESGRLAADGRAWLIADVPVVAALAGAGSFAAVIILALYIQSPEVSVRYGRPEFLWLICLLLIYWLGRLTLLANRGAVHHDPVVFALRDRASWLTAAGIAGAFAAAL